MVRPGNPRNTDSDAEETGLTSENVAEAEEAAKPNRRDATPAAPRARTRTTADRADTNRLRRVTVESENHLAPEVVFARLAKATAHLEPPFAVLDRAAFRANAVALTRRASGAPTDRASGATAHRASGMPIRLASKSIRCRTALIEALSLDGFAGVLGYTLAESLWLAENEAVRDVVVGYPTADRASIARLAHSEALAERVTLMIDSVDQLDLIDDVVPPGKRAEIGVCLDLDASLRLSGGRVHIGVRRSPIHTPADAAVLARRVALRSGFRVDGLMSYEAQIAGVGDSPPGQFFRRRAVRWMQRRSWADLQVRRAKMVDAVLNSLAQVGLGPLRFVNAGGTGSLEKSSADPAVTEVTAGSGLYGPTLFDFYRGFTPRPAALFALPVVRRPARGWVTVAGGGWIASGPPGPDRSPTPVHPAGLSFNGTEGAGEVQTPLRGDAADGLRIGDRVWFRHAKAGELCEHVDVLHVVDGERVVDVVPTYRGEGKAF